MNYNKQIDMCIKELRASIANVYFGFCKGKFCKGCILNKKENSEYTFCKLHYLIHELYGEKKEKAMNYYKQIAEMLGVELGEEFKVSDMEGFTYMFTKDGGLMFRYGADENFYLSSLVLMKLLRGDYSVVKLPWKPKDGEAYWKWATYVELAELKHWNGSSMDFACWKLGNCFKTKEEAQTKGKEIMEAIRKEFEEA